MSKEIYISQDNILNIDDKKYQIEFENEKDQRNYRKFMFFGMGILIKSMFIISFTATYCYIFHINLPIISISKTFFSSKENTRIVILLSLSLMIPIILSLAMMRFLFGNNDQKEEKNIPSIVFNIGKELKETLIAFIDKKKLNYR